ncbi:hypothetical protein GF380_01090 [Candidatus Uhrbacteria bacterium]|nr:hypothetical protein [Candidatus Uhrbacteria bacterium]
MKKLTDGTQQTVELALKGEFSLDSFTNPGESAMSDDVWGEFEDIDDMEGITPRLPQIGIAHSAQMFKMPDGGKSETIAGIIIDHNRCNSYWAKGYDETGGGESPDCFSLDAYKPDPASPQKQAEKCKECPMNQFSGAGKKACKNMRRVHILLPGTALPHRLTLPPSNLRGFDEFVTLQVRQRKLKLLGILVQLSLIPAKSGSGIEYSQVQYSLVQADGKPVVLARTKEQAHALAGFRAEWLEAMRGQEILFDEHRDEGQNFENGDAFDVMQYSAKSDTKPMSDRDVADARAAIIAAFGVQSEARQVFEEAVAMGSWETARNIAQNAVDGE